MSDHMAPVRIRVQSSQRDPETLRFLLDGPVQAGAAAARYDKAVAGAPLASALFAITGVLQVEVDGACIHVRRDRDACWENMKVPIAAAIRDVLRVTDLPLGNVASEANGESDADLLAAVRDLLQSSINPRIASHGGRITAERVMDGTVYLRMSGGCQGCAASQLTLRNGVERRLRAALPDLRDIVDVTDHGAGATPFYTGSPDASGNPFADEGARRSPSPTGGARSGIGTGSSSSGRAGLPDRVRHHLKSLSPSSPTVSYGALARAVGLWLPGSVRKVTQALEETMREDARTGSPFVAARAVSRAAGDLPGKGFFDLARDLSRGPRDDETERVFHAREIAHLAKNLAMSEKPHRV